MTIIVGYLATPEGKAALERAISEAELRKSKLIVVNSARGGSSFTGEDAVKSEEELKKVEERLGAAGIEFEVRQLVRGNDPSDDLIDIAEEVGGDLIVIGLRRRSPVGKLILGSNAQRILLDANCAVLAVKAG
ncbi:universal stress protein [Kribbia dieselivorans]|uniref:universal stress protein n=1 Tax=Kribbia dieselivorans TaxID=331526 RepID=UPI00083969B3|nr:universal stress protein [Kribbia dieselivorans]